MTAYPIDAETLTVGGGHFTTVANQAESKYTYYSRGIGITRSNTVIDGIYHAVTGELDHGAPYGGFLDIANCTGVTVRNCMLSGHKTYVNTFDGYNGPKIFADFNSSYTNGEYKEKYPYVLTEDVSIKNLTIKSGKQYILSGNSFMFRDVRVI